ncbi:MAG: inorganic phosphate transporter [Chloroflexi bacterium]|nr:inorganic phosphate transporter [Chloroflexota bacterium]
MLSAQFALLIVVFVWAVAFDFINGFHDTANAIATVVSTRVLPPAAAILMAAALNFLGAFTGTAVAATIGKGIVDPKAVTQIVVLAALTGAIVWNLITWYSGIPSSSSHALIGGLAGAATVAVGFGTLNWEGLGTIILILLVSPFAGLAAGYVVMLGVSWIFHNASSGRVNRYFRRLQLLSAAFMAFSHGSNDATKTMGIMTMALVSFGALSTFQVPWWVITISALAMALGTAAGGWRIIRTMGTRIISLQPVHGFAAETGAAVIIQVATHFGMPLSTTHVIASSIMGVGASKRFSAVRWGIVGSMFVAWLLTIPASATVAALAYLLFSMISHVI